MELRYKLIKISNIVGDKTRELILGGGKIAVDR